MELSPYLWALMLAPGGGCPQLRAMGASVLAFTGSELVLGWEGFLKELEGIHEGGASSDIWKGEQYASSLSLLAASKTDGSSSINVVAFNFALCFIKEYI